MKVEFRFLHLVTSHVSGERLTIGLFHWDGAELRCATSLAKIPAGWAAHRKTVERYVRAHVRAAKRAADTTKGAMLFGLSEIYPVRRGLGAALSWSDVQGARTLNPGAHFEEIRRLAGLEPIATEPDEARLLRRQLVDLGTELAAKAPERVKVNCEVSNVHEYRSPVSWKNGVWHHTVVVNFARSTARSISEETNRVVGLLHLALPQSHKAIVVSMLPSDTKLEKAAAQEAENIREAFKNVEVLSTGARSESALVATIERRILEDVALH